MITNTQKSHQLYPFEELNLNTINQVYFIYSHCIFIHFLVTANLQKTKPCIQHFLSLLVDQTPTPTRFLRNCEEEGLFQDLENPFDQVCISHCKLYLPVHLTWIQCNLGSELGKIGYVLYMLTHSKGYTCKSSFPCIKSLNHNIAHKKYMEGNNCWKVFRK